MRDNHAMGHWGWRQMTAVFISVWVVGCSTTYEAASTVSPTQSPYPTLVAHHPQTDSPYLTTPDSVSNMLPVTPTPVVYVVQPGDTLLQIARQFGVKLSVLQETNGGIEPLALQIGQALYIPNPQFNAEGLPILSTITPAALSLTPPKCYAAPTDYIICLGQVTNWLDRPIQRVTVVVRLLTADGSILKEGAAGIEQSIIPAGETAPYRLLVKANWDEYGWATAWLESADSAAEAQNRYVTVNIEEQEQQWEDGRYTIKAILHNTAGEGAQLVRAVVTLRDSEEQIIGYRIIQLSGVIAPGERIPLEMSVMPKEAAAAIHHSLYVEALRLEG